MSDDNTDDSQKTEDPTAKKLEDARKKGQVPLSKEINNWMLLFAGTIVIAAFSGSIFEDLAVLMRTYIEQSHAMPRMPGGLGVVVGDAFKQVFMILGVPLAIFVLAAFFSPFIQIGPLFSAEAMKPDISKISIIKGFSRLFSGRSLMEFAKGILKITTIGVVGTIILLPYFEKVEHLIGLPIPSLLLEIKDLIIWLMIGVLIVLLVIAVIDLVYQRYEHSKKMKMSRQEIKDEFKQSEGDPHVKGKLRQLRAEKSRQRMMAAVPEADVIITNPTHYSIALKYDRETMDAPLCVAKGTDEVALRIREVAKDNDIEIFENKPLARALYDVIEIDQSIPSDYFQAVAEIISFVFKKKGKI
ncbi:MAG: flagellar biosynthesis protein FlhB [Alphaproteobacteria bacterium]